MNEFRKRLDIDDIELEPLDIYENRVENFEDDFEFDAPAEIAYKVLINNNWLLTLNQTCSGCPEQYDLIDNLTCKEIAYFRYRWGTFRCDVPSWRRGKTLFSISLGDSFSGELDEEIRDRVLKESIRKVIEYYRFGKEDIEED